MYDLLFVRGEGPRSTWGLLYRLDPRSKLFVLVALLAYLGLESSTFVLILALLGLHLLGLLARPTRSKLLPLWKGLWPLLLMVVVLGSLSWCPTEALISLGPIGITLNSLQRALGNSTRIAALSLAFSLFLWTTEPNDLVVGLTRLGVPFELGFPVVVALQYIGTFRRLFFQILEAQQSRGLSLPRGNPVRLVRTYLPVLIPLIIGALRSADSLALALQSRGFEARGKRTFRRTLHVGVRDWVFMLITAGVLVGLSQV